MLIRALLLSLAVSGCTSPEVACDMRADYRNETLPYMQGKVIVRWQFNADLPPNVNGQTECWNGEEGRFCLLRMRGPPASFNDACGMAKEVHELHHAEGGTHER